MQTQRVWQVHSGATATVLVGYVIKLRTLTVHLRLATRNHYKRWKTNKVIARKPPQKNQQWVKKLTYLFLMVPTREAICCLEMRSRAWRIQETVKRLNQFSTIDKIYFFPSHSLLLFRVIIQPWWIDNLRIVILTLATRLGVTWESSKPTTLSRLQRL